MFDKDYIENFIYIDYGVVGNISVVIDWFFYFSRLVGFVVLIMWLIYFMILLMYFWIFLWNWIDLLNLVCGMVNNIYLFIFL